MTFSEWRKNTIKTQKISPLYFGMRQQDIVDFFGAPDDVSTQVKNGNPLILKYQDIEFHFDSCSGHALFLVYSENTDLCITASVQSRKSQNQKRRE